MDKRAHKNFIKLMKYLNEYKQNICYEGSNLINTNPPKHYNENDYLEIKKAEEYSFAKMFPVETSGPNKGHIIRMRDERGNLVVDPTADVKKDPFFIDYMLY